MMDHCEHVTRAYGMSEGRLARRYVAYYRVSTIQQGQFGFSIEAQRAAVQDYVSANPGSVVAEFSEVMSGRKDRRPELAKALSMCRIAHAVLVIARLDRLSRNVEMIARLMESRLEFVAVDFPHANRFTIHILAAVAEYESRLSSERMKQVIAARRERRAKVEGFASGLPRRFPAGCQEASALMRQARSEARARDLAPLVWKAITEGKSMSTSPMSSMRAASRRHNVGLGRRTRYGGSRDGQPPSPVKRRLLASG